MKRTYNIEFVYEDVEGVDITQFDAEGVNRDEMIMDLFNCFIPFCEENNFRKVRIIDFYPAEGE